jgi:hypothetical protein
MRAMVYPLLLPGDVPDPPGSFSAPAVLRIATICNGKAISEMERWRRSWMNAGRQNLDSNGANRKLERCLAWREIRFTDGADEKRWHVREFC